MGDSRKKYEEIVERGLSLKGTDRVGMRVLTPRELEEMHVISETVEPNQKGNTTDKGEGLRYNTGKLRYDLLHPVHKRV